MSDAATLLADLVAIPSVNPAYDPESAGEAEVASYIERWAIARGFPFERQTVLLGRDNIIVRLDHDVDAPTILLEAHMDTVGVVAGTRGAHVPTRDGDLLYGRGSCDTKGSLVAMMLAMEAVAAQGDASVNVHLLAAVDEEVAGAGARAYVQSGPTVAAAIVGEPTELRIVHAHKGVIRGAIEVRGRAAHTSMAHEGINAIDAMADVIVGLRSVSETLSGGLDHGSLTVSVIDGGSGVNVVPALCTIQYDRRTVPGETSDGCLAAIDDVLEKVRNARPEVEIVRHPPVLDAEPMATAVGDPIVRAASLAAVALGRDGAPQRVPYGTDAKHLNVTGGIPCVVFGPGLIDDAHGADEHVSIRDVEMAAAIIAATVAGFAR
jgi:acetylornithine deacetylase